MTTRRGIDELLAEADERLREFAARPPEELFDQLVRWGFIDREGRVTKLIGGDAEMEPGARPPTAFGDDDDADDADGDADTAAD